MLIFVLLHSLFIYLFLTAMGLRCFLQAFSSFSELQELGGPLCCGARASGCGGPFRRTAPGLRASAARAAHGSEVVACTWALKCRHSSCRHIGLVTLPHVESPAFISPSGRNGEENHKGKLQHSWNMSAWISGPRFPHP